jgi:ATP-dependent DNA helicase RecG
VLIVEGAERFGLAQLHQLRGRVGRGQHQSYCYLLTTADSQARQRLAYLERTQSGFELAEADLQLRGPGALYGTRQHGELDLRIAKLTDARLISEAQRAVKYFQVKEMRLDDYPTLEERVSQQRVLAHLS